MCLKADILHIRQSYFRMCYRFIVIIHVIAIVHIHVSYLPVQGHCRQGLLLFQSSVDQIASSVLKVG